MKNRFTFYFIGLIVASLALVGATLWVIYFSYTPGWDFRNNLYLPVHLLLQQQSPYNIHTLVDGSNAIWLPMVMGLFLPLGYLDIQQANNIWLLINTCALAAIIYITIEQKPPPLPKLIPTILLIFLFPSTITHLLLGQISILICLILVVIIWFGDRISVWAVGFLFAFTLTKPQLIVVFIPTYFYAVHRERGWRELWKMGLWTLVGIVVLCLPVIFIQPDWYSDFIANLMMNNSWAHPSIHVWLFSPLGLVGKMLGWIYIGIGIGVAFYGVSRLGAKEGLLWSLALTPIVSPYIWSWDFVFLYPLMIYSVFQQKNYFKSALLFFGYFIVQVGFIALKFTGRVDDSLSWWIPWSILGVTFIIRLMQDKKPNASQI